MIGLNEDVLSYCLHNSDDGDLASMWPHLVEAFSNLPSNLPAVEVGVKLGGSCMLAMNAISQTQVLRPMFAIDPFNDSVQEGQNTDVRLVTYTLAKEAARLGVSVTVFPMTSAEWMERWVKHHTKFSYVYLDGCHIASNVISELHYFLPRIEPGGLLIVDNRNWPQPSGGVLLDYMIDMFECRPLIPDAGVKLFWTKG